MWACTVPVLITGQLATHPSPGTLRRMTLLGRRSMSSQDTCGITVPGDWRIQERATAPALKY